MNSQPSARSGHFFGERQEVEMRYAYRPEYVPLLLAYLGATPNSTILDVGCGSGFLSRLLARELAEVTVVGLDSDARSLSIARELQAAEQIGSQLRFEPGDGHRLPFADNSFDLVTSQRLL